MKRIGDWRRWKTGNCRLFLLLSALCFLLSAGFFGCGKKEEAKKPMETGHEHKAMEMACNYECCTGDPKCKDADCWNKAMKMCKHDVCPMM